MLWNPWSPRVRKAQISASRRQFLKGASAAALAGFAAGAPRNAWAAPAERKFLFFYAGGGWDTTTVLDPHYDTEGVDMDPDTELRQLGGLQFTGGMGRENTERFFARWGRHAAIINGVDVHSVGHDSARQFVMTGTSASSYSDWATNLAANGRGEYPLPHVVFSGPSYPGTNGQAVVRAGGGSLLELIDGSIVGRSDKPAPLPSTPVDSMIDAFVRDRVKRFADQKEGLGRLRAEGLLSNTDRAMELEGRRFEAGLDDLGRGVLDQAIKATELFRLGLSRTAMVQIPGGYDTHGNSIQQGIQQDAFYGVLDELFEHLSTTPGYSSRYLLDEVVVVALSEFGRTPKLNGGGGKDHWPYGSYLIAGSGVRGNTMYGATDGDLVAMPVDIATGLPTVGGEMLACEHLGLSLLELGGLDSSKFLPGVPWLEALVRG